MTTTPPAGSGALTRLGARSICHLTTHGRRTGRPHEIEIWFAVDGDRVFLLAGGGERADWVRNLAADENVRLRIGDEVWTGRARILGADDPEDALARRLLCAKYQDWREGQPLSRWGQTALPVVVASLALEPG